MRLSAPRILAPLRYRDFRLLLVGQTVSRVGNYFFLVAIPFQLLALGASPVELGIAVTILTLATLLFLLLGGTIADRVPRRLLILTSDAICGVVTGGVAYLAWTGQLRVEHIYMTAAILGVGVAFLDPAINAIVSELVPSELLTQGNAARSVASSVARTVGPGLAGLVVALWSTPAAFAVDSLTFFFSFILLLAARPTPRPDQEEASLLRQVRDGIAFVASTPWLWMAAIAFTILNLSFGGQRGVMTPLFVRDSLREGAAVFGAVIAAYGIGQIAGGIAIAQAGIMRPGIAMYVFEAIAGIATAAVGLAPILPLTILFFATMGIALASSDALYNAALQRNIPRHLIGRVTSINFLLAGLLVPMSPIVAGALIEAVGPAQTFVIAGSFNLVIALLALAVSPVRSLR